MTERHETTLLTIGEAVDALQKTHSDVTHSSLRFLQREGLIDPARTQGGHRKYRVRDLERIRRIKNWQMERISLAEIQERLARLDALPAPDELCRAFLEHALAGRFIDATELILRVDEVGMSLGVIFQDILTPALIHIGELWATGVITVGQEHEVSEVCRDLISRLSLHPGLARSTPHSRVVLTACIQHERHDLGLRMITALLRERGATVHFLGSDTSLEFIEEAIEMRCPDVVVLSVTMPHNRWTVEAVLISLQQIAIRRPHHFRVMLGGRGTSDYASDLAAKGGYVLQTDRLEEVVETILAIDDDA